MVIASGVRIGWADLPVRVRTEVERIVGGRVVRADSQVGGFSPGSADRVVTDTGARAFVKAANLALNEHTPGLYRREAAITAQLPAAVPATQLLGAYDDGDWVALVLADVDGRPPYTPWLRPEVDAVLHTLGTLADRLTPCPVTQIPTAPDELRGEFAGWQRLRADPWPALPALATRHLDELIALSDRAAAAIAGDTLVHLDVRADNLLVRADGSVVLVDWPWACRGCQWLDSLCLLINVELYGGHDVEAILAATPVLAHAPTAAIDAVLAGLCGYFFNAGRRPPHPALPTLKQFQRDQGAAVLGWLARRQGW
jgi:hypothetical protein